MKMFFYISICALFSINLSNAISPTKQSGMGLPCSNRRWALPSHWFSGFRERALQTKFSPLPIFNDTVYLAGVYNRVQSDAMIASLHDPLTNLVIAECVDYKGEFLQTIEDYLNNTVSAKSWSSVAHDRDFDYFYGRAYWIELYSIHIANVLAQTLYMLGDKLSETTKSNVMNALETRILKPMDRHFEGDPDILKRHGWKDSENNWNIVCWGGVATVGISTISDETRRERFVTEAFKGAQYSWKSWKSDGFLHEGGGYFNLAVLQMSIMRQHVMEASEGKNDFFLTNPNADKMLAFGFEYPMSDRMTALFADDSKGEMNAEIRKYIEITYSPNPILDYDIAISWNLIGQAFRYSLFIEPNNRFPVENKRIFETGIRKYYEESGVLICRPAERNGLAASFKLLGGAEDNSGGHNHDDAGTYSIMLNNVNVVGDIGSGSYEVTWNNRFEESEIFNSYSHPLPIIDGKLQTRNMNYYYYKNVTLPKVISTSFSDDSDTIAFDLKSVYPIMTLTTLTRTNIYHRTPGLQSVVVQDRVKFSSATTYEFALPSKNGIWSEQSATSNALNGKFTVGTTSINVRIQATNPFRYSSVTKTVLGLTYTRLGVSFMNPILEDTITVTFN